MNACTHLQDREVLANRRPIDAAYVIHRLEEAGATLLALPGKGYSTRMRVSGLDFPPETGAAPSGVIRPPVPSAERITRMDEALAWLSLIPRESYVLRRILGARALVSPVTERHLFSWRQLGRVLGADHKAVQRWHAQAVDMIVAALNPAADVRSVAEPAPPAVGSRAWRTEMLSLAERCDRLGCTEAGGRLRAMEFYETRSGDQRDTGIAP